MTDTLFDQPLLPFPGHSYPSGLSLRVESCWLDNGRYLYLRYVLQMPNLSALRWPLPQATGPADGLWQHLCFEAFVGHTADSRYQEYNFSPCGRWAHYHFAAQRVQEKSPPTQGLLCKPPTLTCTFADAHTFWQEVVVDAGAWHAFPHGWTLGLCAVIESIDGAKSYWALHHPRPQPDFHHPAARTIALASPTSLNGF